MRKRVRVVIVVGMVLCLGLGGILAFEVKYWNKIYPGVKITDSDLGGMSRDEARELVRKKTENLEILVVRWGNNRWELPIGSLGVEYDIDETVEEATKIGRSGEIWKDLGDKIDTLRSERVIEPVYIADDNKLAMAIAGLASQINIPAKEPEVLIETGTKNVVVMPGENGQEVDERMLMARIRDWVRKMKNDLIEIPVIQLRPRLTENGLELARKRAESLLGKKITLELTVEKQKWEVGDEQILLWLDPQNEGWKRVEIEGWVAELAHTVDRPAQNASVRIASTGKAEEFKPAKDGYRVKQGEFVDLMVKSLSDLERSGGKETWVELLMSTEEPEVKTGDVNDLGIKELLGKGESWYAGSITNRFFNLKKAAEALNGVLIPPGEVFSFNKTVG